MQRGANHRATGHQHAPKIGEHPGQILDMLAHQGKQNVVATLVAQGQRTEVEVIGVASFAIDQGFMEWRTLARLVGSTNSQGEPAPTSMLIQLVDSDPTVEEVDDVIDELDELLLSEGIAASHVNQIGVAEEIAQLITMFGSIFQIAAIVMAVIGAIGLLSTLSMSVFERLREIGIMRSIGAGSVTIASQFLRSVCP